VNLVDSKQRFGAYWLFFGYSLALHVMDEASHNFLAFYNPNAQAVRRALPWLPMPVFTPQSFLASLALALSLWLALAPLAFRGANWLRRLAIPAAIVLGMGNALLHTISSIYYSRLMPGVYSAPLIFLAGVVLLRSALRKEPAK
jgi:Protein of unknown function with HXXEE motif